MPYEVLADTSIPRVIAKGTDGHEIRESIVHAIGDVIGDDAVAPEIKERLEAGDDRTCRLLRHVSGDEAVDLQKKSGQSGSLSGSIVNEKLDESNPEVPQSAEISEYEEPQEDSQAATESPDPEPEVEEAAEVEVKKNDFKETAKKKAAPKKKAPKKKAPKKKAPKK